MEGWEQGSCKPGAALGWPSSSGQELGQCLLQPWALCVARAVLQWAEEEPTENTVCPLGDLPAEWGKRRTQDFGTTSCTCIRNFGP